MEFYGMDVQALVVGLGIGTFVGFAMAKIIELATSRKG